MWGLGYSLIDLLTCRLLRNPDDRSVGEPNSKIDQLIIAGVGLSIVGLIMQQLTRNKFVSPTTAGTMDSARLGILVSMLMFNSANMLVQVGLAFLFAFASDRHLCLHEDP